MSHDPSWRGSSDGPDRRRTPRMRMSAECTLARRNGSTVTGRTLDLGFGGMCVTTTRPLSVDEVLDFEMPPRGPEPLMGEVRVMREQGYGVYALRFERLAGRARTHLRTMVEDGRAPDGFEDAGSMDP